MKKYYFSILVKNESGVLERISGLFSRRGYNIESLSVCATEQPDYSRMTIAVFGDEKIIVQIIKQLEKQVYTVKVRKIEEQDSVMRELLLCKCAVSAEKRQEILNICTIFKAKTIDLTKDSMILEITGTPSKIDAFIEVIMPYSITELARSGVSALERGESCLKDSTEENL